VLRRHCPRCRHKPCEAERDCGGPEALALIEQQPLKQPLRPAEIPMKLPVRLNFGFQQPEVERARIRRVPDLPPEALRQPCDRCTDPNCPGRCTQPAGNSALRPLYDYQTSPPNSPTVDPQVGPAPMPDAEARQTSGPHGIRLGSSLSRRNHSYGRLAALP
jgi:hypothetical protein